MAGKLRGAGAPLNNDVWTPVAVLDPAALGVVAVALAGLVAAGLIPPLLGVPRADPARLLRSLQPRHSRCAPAWTFPGLGPYVSRVSACSLSRTP